MRAATDTIHRHNRKQAEAVIAIGRALLEVKQALKHGQFGRWLTHEFGWSRRSAQLFMSAAKTFGDNCAMIAHLQPNTLYALAAPSLPERAREEVLGKLTRGDQITDEEVWSTMKRATAERRFDRSRKQTRRLTEQGLTTEQHVDAIVDFFVAALTPNQLYALLGLIDKDRQAFVDAINVLLKSGLYRPLDRGGVPLCADPESLYLDHCQNPRRAEGVSYFTWK